MRKDLYNKKNEIVTMNKNGYNITHIASKYKAEPLTIKRLFDKWDIQVINHEKKRLEILDKEKQKIILMNNNGFCISKIAKIYNVDPLTINKKFKKWNIPYLKQKHFYERKYRPYKRKIIDLYNSGYSQFMIADKLNLKPDAIITQLKNWKIKLRPKTYQNDLIKTLDGNFVRSNTELIISNFLYSNSIKYKYEKKVGSFKCDFYLIKENLYIEYWGSLYRSKTYYRKLRYYKKNNLKLFSIYPFEDITKCLDKLKNNINEKKHLSSKPTLWYFPLERLPERYTLQLHNWLTKKFIDYNINYIIIEDEERKNQRITTGQVLDTNETITYKSSQVINFIKRFQTEFRDGDKLFFSDIWFPGIEGIIYSLVQTGYSFEVYGLLHSGTFDEYDFTKRAGLDWWMRYFEKQFFHLATKIFIGSEHMREITSKGLKLNKNQKKKLVVTGMPFMYREIQQMVNGYKNNKEHWIVFPNRFNIEKDPETMLNIMNDVMKKDIKVKLILTTSHKKLNSEYPYLIDMLNDFKKKYKNRVIIKSNLTKKQYYEILAKSKIALFTSKQETFGYCLAEAVSLGCIPICINKLSYVDVLGIPDLLFNSNQEAVDKIIKCLYLKKPIKGLTTHFKKYKDNIDLMLKEMNLI